MTRSDIQAEFDRFIEFPAGSPRMTVTVTSAVLFAEHIARMATSAERMRCAQIAEKDTLCRYEGWVEPLERFFHAAYAAGVKSEQDRCCKIVYGMAGSDNVAQRTVDAIRGKE